MYVLEIKLSKVVCLGFSLVFGYSEVLVRSNDILDIDIKKG